MLTSSKYPVLRFPEYSGDWHTVNAGSAFDFRNGVNFTKEATGQAVKVLGVGEFQKNERFDDPSNLPEVALAGSLDERDLLKENDLVFVRSNGNKALIGRCLQIGALDQPVSFSGFTIRARRTTDELLDSFSGLLFRSRQFKKHLHVTGGGSSISNLSQSILAEFDFRVPSIEEQDKIASFIQVTDKKICLLADKIKELTEYKSGCMQQLFSREVRFKDDHGNKFPDWVEKELGDIGSVRTSSVDKLSREHEPPAKLLNYMDVYRRDHIRSTDEFQEITAPKSQHSVADLRKGDILFTPSSETPTDIGHSAVVVEDLPGVLFSYHLMRFRPEADILLPEFSGYAFKGYSFYVELWKRAQGATRYTLSKGALEEAIVAFPSSMEEQQKIAAFLSELDRKISLVSQELELAQTFKQGLLQQMFV